MNLLTLDDTKYRQEIYVVSETYPHGILIPMAKLNYSFSEELNPNSVVMLSMTIPAVGNYYGTTDKGLKIFIIPESYENYIPEEYLELLDQVNEEDNQEGGGAGRGGGRGGPGD